MSAVEQGDEGEGVDAVHLGEPVRHPHHQHPVITAQAAHSLSLPIGASIRQGKWWWWWPAEDLHLGPWLLVPLYPPGQVLGLHLAPHTGPGPHLALQSRSRCYPSYYTHLSLDEPSPSPADQLGLVQAPGVQVEHNLDWHIIIQWQSRFWCWLSTWSYCTCPL